MSLIKQNKNQAWKLAKVAKLKKNKQKEDSSNLYIVEHRKQIWIQYSNIMHGIVQRD